MNKTLLEIKNRPWLLTLELNQLLTRLLLMPYLYICGVRVGRKPKFYGLPRILRHAGSIIIIGDMFENRNTLLSNPLVISHPTVIATHSKIARVEIGNNVGISGGNIVCQSSIYIGDYTMIGSNCLIIDTDFHPISPTGRRYSKSDIKSKPVTIGKNVFIGTRSIILKGVTIGDNSVIAAGSVVSKNVPSNSIYTNQKITALKR